MSVTSESLPKLNLAELREECYRAETELLEISLADYVGAAWHVVEPATRFVPGWHLDVICEHLEAVSRGEIRNLIINVPPRHMKSLAVSVFWPTWEWITNPHLRYIYSSYGQDLSTRDALKSRRLIQSPWYQARWGRVFALTGDQNQKTRYENDKTGYRIATGVGGMATGEGGDRLVLDDPHKLADAHSDAALDTATTFWNETMSTRLNDPETGAKVVIMQRLHERDVTGDIVEKMKAGGEPYEMLVLPAEYEPTAQLYVSSIDWEDPREEEGELLWPERFNRASIKTLKASLGSQASGQLQQRPVPAGGAIFRREWWQNGNRFDVEDAATKTQISTRWISWDTGLKDKEDNAYTACVVGELHHDYRLMIREVWRGKPQFPELVARIRDTAERHNKDGKLRDVLIEDKASGISVYQTLRDAIPRLGGKLVPFPPQGGKEQRWSQAAFWCSVGCVNLPEPSASAPWLYDFEEELFNVPAARFKDQADAFAQLVIHLEHVLARGWRFRGMPEAS